MREEDFESIYNDVKDIMVALSRKYYYINGYEEEDLMQEMSITLLSCIEKYDISRETSFRGYVSLCLNRTLRDKLKVSRRSKNLANCVATSLHEYVNEGGDITLEDLIADSVDIGEIVASRDNVRRVLETAKKLLSKREYKVFNKRVMMEETYSEIKRDMKITDKAIDNSLQRARKKLRKYYMNRTA